MRSDKALEKEMVLGKFYSPQAIEKATGIPREELQEIIENCNSKKGGLRFIVHHSGDAVFYERTA